jgi:hypothetical protein
MTLANLKSFARFLATGASSNSTDFADADVLLFLNDYYHEAGQIAMMNGGEWQPFAEQVKIDLAENQAEYLLTDTDVNIRRVQQVWIKPTASSEYLLANKRDMANIATDPTTYKPYPPEYDLFEDSIIVYMDAIPTLEDGIMIYCQTDITALANDTDTPQLPDCVQRYMAIGAAYTYALSKSDGAYSNRAEKLKRDLIEKANEIAVYYANRNAQTVKLTPADDEMMSGEDLY